MKPPFHPRRPRIIAILFVLCVLISANLACSLLPSTAPASSAAVEKTSTGTPAPIATKTPTEIPPAPTATTQPEIAQSNSPQVVYQSDFSTSDGWTAQSDLSIENNQLTFGPDDYSLAWADTEIPTLGDFSMTATFSYVAQEDYGVAVVIGDPSTNNFFFLCPNPHQGDTAWYFVMVLNDRYIHNEEVPTPITEGQPEEFSVEIRREGDQVTAYGNGEFLMTRDDIVFEGQATPMQVGVYSDGYGNVITLTDITVTALPSASAAAGSDSSAEMAIEVIFPTGPEVGEGYARLKTDILFDAQLGYREIATYDRLPGDNINLASLQCIVSILDHQGEESDVVVAGLTPVEAPQVGVVSQAYRLDLAGGVFTAQFNFVQGNIMVSLQALNEAGDSPLEVADLAAVAEGMVSRMHGNLAASGIEMPDATLDESLVGQYFSNLETGMGVLQVGGPAQVTTTDAYGAGEGFPCVVMDTTAVLPGYTLALYDENQAAYLEKIVVPISIDAGHYEVCTDFSMYGLAAGNYRFRLLVEDALAEELPFVIE